MSYAIFRVEPIRKLSDLAQIGSHNKREKKAYKSNPDIDITKTKNNIEIVPLSEKYIKGFYNLTKEYKKEHDKRTETMRDDRKRSFKQMVDDSNNVVADELLFTSDLDFFKGMSNKQIRKWADTCMEFVYEDLGYKEEQILHATIHLDEKTPHLHCVVVPLIKKFDKRANTEKWTISKKQYMKDRLYLSTLQDKYHKRMIDNGYNLDRGIKNSDNEHIDIKQYKKITRKLNLEIESKSNKLNNAMEELEQKMETSKETIFDKEYVKVKKDTFDSMNKVIKETKKVAELQPKIKKVYDEVDTYAKSYKALEKENDNIYHELDILKYKNNKLENENNRLKRHLEAILKAIKEFFRYILRIGNKESKQEVVYQITDYYDNNDFDKSDVYDIAVDTEKEEELFDYCEIDNDFAKDKEYDDFEI